MSKIYPAGFAGTTSRSAGAIIDTIKVDATVTAFGRPVATNAGVAVAATTVAGITGVIVRSVPSTLEESSGAPKVGAFHGRQRKGFVAVKCAVGTPARDGAVYMRTVAASGKLVGDLEATADGSNNAVVPGWTWAVDGKDANGIAEIFMA